MRKTKRVIAAVTAAIITATSTSLMSVFADENGGSDFGFVSKSTTNKSDNIEAVESNAQLYEKLAQLLKQGDSLKYGEALYTTGTPDGEKWTKEFYEQRVDFYGEEFLAKYIVNGEFLRDKVVSNMTEITTKEKNSGLKATAEDINEYMRSNGISGFTYVREVDGVEKIFISYDGFFEKIKAYVVDTGVDESLVVYQQSQDDVIVSDKSDNENNLKVYADEISDFMLKSGIAGYAFVHDNKVVVTYSAHEDKIKVYVKEKGIDESVIVYESGKNVDETSPTNINVDYSEQYHQVRFTWDKVEYADRYGIAVYLAGKWRIQDQNITGTVYTTPKNLIPGKTYNVAIAARVNGKWDTENAIKNAVEVTIK